MYLMSGKMVIFYKSFFMSIHIFVYYNYSSAFICFCYYLFFIGFP